MKEERVKPANEVPGDNSVDRRTCYQHYIPARSAEKKDKREYKKPAASMLPALCKYSKEKLKQQS